MPTNRKGARRERELVRELADRGWTPIRTGGSGSGTDRELPDVLAGKAGASVAFEAKSTDGSPVYVNKDEVADLRAFALPFGAVPLLAVRFDREPWLFVRPQDCHRTPAGAFRVKREMLESDAAMYFPDL